MGEWLFEWAKSELGEAVVGMTFERFSKWLPVKRVKETKKVIAFWHPKPFWEKHVVIVPKKAIRSLMKLRNEDDVYVAEVFRVAREIVEELGWDKEEYTLLVNGGRRQKIAQIHWHLSQGEQIKN